MNTSSVAAMDAVVLWVDGDDPRHQAKRERHGAERLRNADESASTTRFRSIGEIDYCLASLLRFAPFLRRIHVITDEQTPPLMAQADRWPSLDKSKLVQVDHRHIYAGMEDLLPTFNSSSIETLLHRVPGLSEHFVYLNDDFMLIRPVQAEDWFIDGRPVVRGHWARQPQHKPLRRLRRWLAGLAGRASEPPRFSFRGGQALSAQLAGRDDSYFVVGHNPRPLRRSTLESFEQAHPEQVRRNASHRWRTGQQYLSYSLATHLELAAHTATAVADLRLAYVKPARESLAGLARQLDEAGNDPGKLFICLQSLDEASPAAQQCVVDWLARRIAPD